MPEVYKVAMAALPLGRDIGLVMEATRPSWIRLLVFALAVALQPGPAHAQSREQRDGQRDFDFEIGTWTTRLSLLPRPLTGSTSWVEYAGTTVVRKVLNGRANLVELDATGARGRLQGLSLRLYNPESRQWALNFSNVRTGTLSPPVTGAFTNGRGEFYGQESLDGRAVFVRFVISVITADSVRFEQAFSADGGRTWEVNWIATDTRLEEAAAEAR